jgi:hypothetical protein
MVAVYCKGADGGACVVNESNLPALMSLLPPHGVASVTVGNHPVLAVSKDLCRIAAFLQRCELSAKLLRIDDWWEHDGLFFDRGAADYQRLFRIIGTPRSLLDSASDDDRVFVGIAALDRSWYLRFRVEWDDDDASLVGEYSITLDPELARQYAICAEPELVCPTCWEESAPYFEKISAG